MSDERFLRLELRGSRDDIAKLEIIIDKAIGMAAELGVHVPVVRCWTDHREVNAASSADDFVRDAKEAIRRGARPERCPDCGTVAGAAHSPRCQLTNGTLLPPGHNRIPW